MKYSLLVNRAKKLLNQIESRVTAPGISFVFQNHPSPPTAGLVVTIPCDARYLNDGRMLAYSSDRGHFTTASLQEYIANRPLQLDAPTPNP